MSNNEQELVRRRGNSKEPVCDQEVLDSEGKQTISTEIFRKCLNLVAFFNLYF